MEENKVLRLIYTFFVGILLVIFVGVGINTFYEPPAPPKYPIALNTYGKVPTAEQAAAQREFDRENEKYQEVLKPYNRNVSVITLAAAVALFIGSALTQKRIRLLADGIMLGGLFTLFYSIGRGFASDNGKYVFTTVTIGLIIVLYLGYHRFVRERPPVKTAK